MFRLANPTDIAMLRRILGGVVSDLGIETHSDEYEALAAHLLNLFEAVKDEEQLGIMIRRAAMIHRRTGSPSVMRH